MREPTPTPTRSLLRLEVGVSLAIVLVGLAFAGAGLFTYGIWQNRGPGPGFFPFLAGLLTAVPAVVVLFGKAMANAPRLEWRSLLPAVAIVAAVLLVPVVGMVEAMGLFILVWVRFAERRSWRDALVAAVSGFVFTHLVFSVWLQVVFPDSLVPSVITLWN